MVELVIPFVIVLLFVSIGQAEFINESPALELSPEKFGPQILYYNDKYSKMDSAADTATVKAPSYNTDPEDFVTQNMMCSSKTGCEKEGTLWTEKKKITIPTELVSSTQTNETLQMLDFESQTYAKRAGEWCNIFINEVSHSRTYLVPKAGVAQSLKFSDLMPTDPTKFAASLAAKFDFT